MVMDGIETVSKRELQGIKKRLDKAMDGDECVSKRFT